MIRPRAANGSWRSRTARELRGDALRWTSVVVLWIALWGELSVGNVLAGALVATGVLALVPHEPGAGLRLRPVALARWLAFVTWIFAKSTWIVAVRVLSPSTSTKKAIIATPVEHASPEQIAIITAVIGFSPGSMVVDMQTEPTVLYLHVFHAKDPDYVREETEQLERLTLEAFPVRGNPEPLPARGEVSP